MTQQAALATCPSQERLRQLLSGELVGNDFALVETHIESCTECQSALARLSDGTITGHWRPVHVEVSTSHGDTTKDFLDGAKQRQPLLDDVTPTPDRLGDYEIIKELGRGGMGIVYLARDMQLGHQVALKVLKAPLATESKERARFIREGRAAATIKHDHVVRVYTASSSPEYSAPYLVMEFVEGEPLDQLLKRDGPPTPQECGRLVQQAAWGLAAAHERNLVHRDIKPANLMVETSTRRVKIMDFGLARPPDVEDNQVTRAGDIVGTPVYMSPEHITNPAGVNGLSDIFSVGVMLYEMMTGVRPFAGLRHMVLRQILDSEPRPPRQLNDAIPRDLETI